MINVSKMFKPTKIVLRIPTGQFWTFFAIPRTQIGRSSVRAIRLIQKKALYCAQLRVTLRALVQYFFFRGRSVVYTDVPIISFLSVAVRVYKLILILSTQLDYFVFLFSFSFFAAEQRCRNFTEAAFSSE